MSAEQAKAEKKKAKKKKKHVSKHVLQAQEDMRQKKEELAKRTASEKEEEGSSSTTPKKKKRKVVVKDPTQVAEYLQTWKNDRKNWKFNKNTQSWLIRHMYQADKLQKGTFQILMEYLQGLQGGTTKQRILVDASTRAMRYREYEKKLEKKEVLAGDDAEEIGKDKDINKSVDEEEKEEVDRWTKLSNHDKRKEYKRARKVLETLKEWGQE